MAEPLSRDEFVSQMTNLRGDVRHGFEDINDRLDLLNGRVYEHHGDIQKIKERTSDRRAGVVTGAKYGGGLTAIIAGVPYVIEWIVKIFQS